MNQERWTAVDRYVADHLVPQDPALEAALESSARAGLPPINVSPPQGNFLRLVAQIQQARKILEVGTLGGYSTIWLAGALPPDGDLVTLESNVDYADVAVKNIAHAGFEARVELRLGLALDSLPQLVVEQRGPFDLVFIDADKPSTPEYFEWSLKLSRRGTVILVDNVVRGGAIVDVNSDDRNVQGMRRFFERISAEPRIAATTVQTVGSKGYDGFTIARVIA